MRLIDAEMYCTELYNEMNYPGRSEEFMTAIDVAIADLADAPTIDAVPAQHGKWEIVVGSNGKEYMVCTCCRVSQDLTGIFTYCPNCGAKMDGAAD